MKDLKPNYSEMPDWELYAPMLLSEYQQCIDEGLDIEQYKDLFVKVANLPQSEGRERLADALFFVVQNAKIKDGYKYNEPSDLDSIKKLRKKYDFKAESLENVDIEDKIYGAWLGRICGCLLGKTVEGARTDELIPFLKETGNYPMYRYILKSDATDEICSKYSFGFGKTCHADTCDGMPVDDDTNYVVLAQMIIDEYGRDFKPSDVSKAWLDYQSIYAYFTAERVAFCNFIKGYQPPQSAEYKNAYREWIGAQIRGDYFGYINPGDSETASDMAFRDASISHIKNGIYGEMWASAMISCAAVTDNIEDIIFGGLSKIPYTSRLYEAIRDIVSFYKDGVSYDECVKEIHKRFDEHTGYGWCHTISNAMIVAASLLYGEGDFGKSICMAVQAGFDTDCNGATVGSVLGMRGGKGCIGKEWTEPLKDTLHTSIFGVGTVKISDRVKMTLSHLKK